MASCTSTEEFVGRSPAFDSVVRTARLVAATDVTVLILGESGTGKEKLAHEIHRASSRKDKPFGTINCASLPETLAESELFGHRKGAFSGADAHHEGRIRAVNGGTLFLDEIGELSLAVQAKLLRFLESKECQPVGENSPTIVDVRVIAATNRNLDEMVELKLFRKDLLYRINIVPLAMPSLRERPEDVEILLSYFTQTLALRHNLAPPHYTSAAIQMLSSYSWPGNVRELRNLCERLLILRTNQEIDGSNLPLNIRQGHEYTTSRDQTFSLISDMEIELITSALRRNNGNRTRAAQALGITRDTLNYRLKKYAL